MCLPMGSYALINVKHEEIIPIYFGHFVTSLYVGSAFHGCLATGAMRTCHVFIVLLTFLFFIAFLFS